MSDEQLVLYCSPTLAGLKTGSLFSCSYVPASKVPSQEDQQKAKRESETGSLWNVSEKQLNCAESMSGSGNEQELSEPELSDTVPAEGAKVFRTTHGVHSEDAKGLESLSPESREQVIAEFRDLNRDLSPKGLRVMPLRIRNGRVLTYLYRPAELEKDFAVPDCRTLLDQLGYVGLDSEACIVRLRERLQNCGADFPHEIGLFLGYPVEDVRGFIEKGSDRCKCTGHWKVYGDEHAAQKLFRKYDSCTACYLEQLAAGTTLERLAVAG